jgi:hypothetical protein
MGVLHHKKKLGADMRCDLPGTGWLCNIIRKPGKPLLEQQQQQPRRILEHFFCFSLPFLVRHSGGLCTMICPRGSLGTALAYLFAKHGIICLDWNEQASPTRGVGRKPGVPAQAH